MPLSSFRKNLSLLSFLAKYFTEIDDVKSEQFQGRNNHPSEIILALSEFKSKNNRYHFLRQNGVLVIDPVERKTISADVYCDTS